jgi:hypothetical protein
MLERKLEACQRVLLCPRLWPALLLLVVGCMPKQGIVSLQPTRTPEIWRSPSVGRLTVPKPSYPLSWHQSRGQVCVDVEMLASRYTGYAWTYVSSGHEELDAAACDAARKIKLQPARCLRGQPIRYASVCYVFGTDTIHGGSTTSVAWVRVSMDTLTRPVRRDIPPCSRHVLPQHPVIRE